MPIETLGVSEKLAMTDAIMRRMREVVGVDSDYKLAKFIGKSTSALSNWRKRGSIPIEECISLSVTHGVSLDWLVLGNGEPPSGDCSFPHAQASQASQASQVREIPASLLEVQGYASIPLYDIEGAAGYGAELVDELIESKIYFERELLRDEGLDPAQTIGARVRGSSMEPTLFDGQRVMVDRSKKRPDGIFLFRRDGELFIKRIQRLPGNAWNLISDNRMYETQMVDPLEVQRIEVIGRIDLAIGRVK